MNVNLNGLAGNKKLLM